MYILGILFICTVGTLLHFVYEWSGENKLVSVFAAVNESTWEHIKICMTPSILWGLYEFWKYGEQPNYLFAKSMSLLTIIVLIPILFYSYTIFTKKSVLFIDVICFYFTVVCSQQVFVYLAQLPALNRTYQFIGYILLFLELAAYFLLTLMPPKNFLFKDPITHKYGIEGHPHEHHH